MKRLRLSSLLFAMVILALIGAIVAQERRISKLEALAAPLPQYVADPPLAPMEMPSEIPSAPIPPAETISPFDTPTPGPTKKIEAEKPPIDASPFDTFTPNPAKESEGEKPSATALKPVSPPSRSLPSPSNPSGVPLADRIQALDQQIEALTKERDRLKQEKSVQPKQP